MKKIIVDETKEELNKTVNKTKKEMNNVDESKKEMNKTVHKTIEEVNRTVEKTVRIFRKK